MSYNYFIQKTGLLLADEEILLKDYLSGTESNLCSVLNKDDSGVTSLLDISNLNSFFNSITLNGIEPDQQEDDTFILQYITDENNNLYMSLLNIGTNGEDWFTKSGCFTLS